MFHHPAGAKFVKNTDQSGASQVTTLTTRTVHRVPEALLAQTLKPSTASGNPSREGSPRSSGFAKRPPVQAAAVVALLTALVQIGRSRERKRGNESAGTGETEFGSMCGHGCDAVNRDRQNRPVRTVHP